MLEFLRGKASERKLRLFCCACCRQVWDRLGWGGRRAVAIGERYADGTAGWWGSYRGEFLALLEDNGPERLAIHITMNRWAGGPGTTGIAAALQVARQTRGDDPTGAEAAAQAGLLRELTGPFPFRVRWPWQRRGLNVPPEWLTSDVVLLARGMYAERALDRLPILADALQDVGCDNDEILSHCRADGPHVRGCWVVDLVLGKS
jgi:hypothetical protein